ncbi:MAG: pyruvate formate lyase family protein [Candidatus Malihini olakiniferum]
MFTKYHKTHNQGVFDVYTPDIRRCRKSGVLTCLPDACSLGRIIGDYRRVALYGIDYLMKDKFAQFTSLQSQLENGEDLEATIRLREEITDQHHALAQIKEMAAKYGCDISGPGYQRERSRSMDLLKLPGCGEISERCCHVLRSRIHLPGRFHRT